MKIDLKSTYKTFSGFVGRSFAQINRSRRARAFFLLAAFLPGLVVILLFIVAPVHTAKTHLCKSEEPRPPKAAETAVDSSAQNSAQPFIQRIDSLRGEKSYYQALLETARRDTFSLSLNLRDSLFCLYIKGVPVRQCRIAGFQHSRLFDCIRSHRLLYKTNSTPFSLQRDFATIRKIPIKVIHAPKDTIEAERMAQKIKLEKPDVYCRLYFSANLIIDISQTTSPSLAGTLKRLVYQLRCSFYALTERIKALAHLRTPAHPLWIKIRLSEEDAKATYRALHGDIRLALLI
ncbi:hypothetical protein JXA02_08690 [candidate division KSB1 bacterium]|nr:hypothetical protein [candidate division KSB1 bacterium]RQW05173.1 MAG: hypothetical protein EH222_10260 [candidate division KSB1 bacterium]